MAKQCAIWILGIAVLLCAGCVSQSQYDGIAKANLQLQDKLAASQAERVKTRTQIALLRQELVQSKQTQQDINDRLQALTVETDTLRARLDIQARRTARGPVQTQPAAIQIAR